MRNMYKVAGSVALVLSMAVMPMSAYAASLTSDQVNAIVSLLKSFNVGSDTIQTVQQVLAGQPLPMGPGMMFQGGSTASSSFPGVPGIATAPGQIGKAACIAFNRDLEVGSQGDDVMELQKMLASDPNTGFTSEPTGYFGRMTAQAMMRFQETNGITTNSSGRVGPLTRGFFERRCGRGLGGGEDMGRAVVGTISANNGSNIVIATRDSNSVTVNITASTTVMVVATSTAPTTGSTSNLTVGQTVQVMGARNSDGSIDALRIMVGVPLMLQNSDNNSSNQNDH
ncbi:MAG TPA: peptidoglycan-binding protein [Candidatus Paceibacterota bacterium]